MKLYNENKSLIRCTYVTYVLEISSATIVKKKKIYIIRYISLFSLNISCVAPQGVYVF